MTAEMGARLYGEGDLLGAEACWLAALRLGGGDEDRRATLTNLATVEDVLSREAPRWVTPDVPLCACRLSLAALRAPLSFRDYG